MDDFSRGAAAFNAGAFFEAHEAWEDAWRPMPRGPERDFVQGLIQLAVAALKKIQGNEAGYQSMVAKGIRRVSGIERSEDDPWRQWLRAYQRWTAGDGPPVGPPPPVPTTPPF